MTDWTEDEDAALSLLISLGWPSRPIARQIGRTQEAVRARRKRLSVPRPEREYLTISIPSETAEWLHRQSAARLLTLSTLVSSLLVLIQRDDLVKAILDIPVERQSARPAVKHEEAA